ncbi:uncharacterized protein LOC128243507 [Mya arenaria]|uniref:uncharacterized protein LOC128243507 n=1 Tax=Mya arenaria TaxID=6604 RepID=UPI0022E7F797|nr:uncharacterized protein LOC128243507 [Mya arenaria]
MTVTRAVIGVDVGGTNTDAVIIDKSAETLQIISEIKTHTTADVTTGVSTAIHLALIASRKENRTLAIQQVNIGTTHFINAVVEGKRLAKVAVIRLCGTASKKLPPFSDFEKNLLSVVRGSLFLVNGGYQFDGQEITPVDEKEILNCVEILKANGEENIVVSGIFSPVRQQQENRVVELIQKVYPEASITATHEIGKIGLLERENAAVLNECIKPLCLQTIRGFRRALDDLGIKCPLYLTQNDGTILSEKRALKFPVFSFASGATNSMRGAAYLTGLKEALICDIGGTSTDVGILQNGFPREASAEVKIGGIRTNFRMPDVISIGLGGGSYVRKAVVKGKEQMKVGPQSAGFRIVSESLVFAESSKTEGRVVTATDIAVAAGFGEVGNKESVSQLEKNFVKEAVDKIHNLVGECVDKMRFNDRNLPLVLVGGGSIIIGKEAKFEGVSEIIIPEHFGVANAVGAALSQVSATADKVVDLEHYVDKPKLDKFLQSELEKHPDADEDLRRSITEKSRKGFYKEARDMAINEIIDALKAEAVASGAKAETLTVVERYDVTLSYIPGSAVRIKVKLVGDLLVNNDSTEQFLVDESVYNRKPVTGEQTQKQTMTTTGVVLTDEVSGIEVREPEINQETGEWILTPYDIECLSIGAGIMGCGGGGNPHIGYLLALKALESGKKMRVVTPSRFMKTAHQENDLVSMVAFMGAPLIFYEKLITGNETVGALQCMQDLYLCGDYDTEACDLRNKDGVEVKKEDGVVYIDNYTKRAESGHKQIGKTNIVAIMSCEIGGMNCLEPLIVGAELELPILDCDGMGRAFPELQMFAPFMYGYKPYPATMADDKGRRAAVLKIDTPKHLEDHLRAVAISMGCSSGISLTHLHRDEIMKFTIQHSLSHARRIGDTVLRARAENRAPVKALVDAERGKYIMYGKIVDVLRETTGGFNRGKIDIDGLDEDDGKKMSIEFQNEFLTVRDVTNGNSKVLVCVPDLITMMDSDTAQPIPTEEVSFGMRVAIVAFRVNPVMSSEMALKFVGPQAFGLDDDVKYVPIGEFIDDGPIAPK